jgi:cobalt-zinc-cadmium efflux system membrane fusion protein
MKKKQIIAIIAMVVAGSLFGAFVMLKDDGKNAGDAAGTSEKTGHADAKEHGDSEHHGSSKDPGKHAEEKGHADKEHHADVAAKGPHGGQLFNEGDFGLEIVLAEEKGEARFRIYSSDKGKPLPPAAAKVAVTLNRPDGEKQDIAFAPEKDALLSTASIAEPHVFEATIAAQRDNTRFIFTFRKEEGKIKMTDSQVKTSGVTLQTAGAARINSSLKMPGEIRFNEDRTAHVVPRVNGIVESVSANLGQPVKKGAILAVIASTTLSEQRSELLAAQKRLEFARTTYGREKQLWEEKISARQDYQKARQDLREAEIALQNAQQKLKALGANPSASGGLNRFEVRAPFDGMVVEKHIALGESLKEDAKIFTLSDLGTVWAEIAVPAKDMDKVRVGGETVVRSTTSDSKAAGKIAYVGSLIGEQTRSAKARVVLQNPQMAWRPGLYVNVELTDSAADVPVAVSADAVQSVNEKPVVFMRVADGFVAQPVVTGRTDGKLVEIVKGLKPGVRYVAAGSFVIKAEQGKSSAGHED